MKKMTIVEKIICCITAGFIFISTPFAQLATAALTKGGTVLDNWTAVAANTTAQGAVANLSGAYQSGLSVWAALTSTTATTNGTLIEVLVSPSATGNTTWSRLTAFAMLSGFTAVTQNMNFTAASTNIVTANTTGFTNQSYRPWIYVKDSTIANSEIAYMTSFSSNANITTLDPITTGHANTTPVWNQVDHAVVVLPDWAQRVKVVYNNKQDPSGSGVDVSSAIGNLTGI